MIRGFDLLNQIWNMLSKKGDMKENKGEGISLFQSYGNLIFLISKVCERERVCVSGNRHIRHECVQK